MWAFFSRRLRLWLLVAVALPVVRSVVHRLAVAAEHHNGRSRTTWALHRADSAVTAASRQANRARGRNGRRGGRR